MFQEKCRELLFRLYEFGVYRFLTFPPWFLPDLTWPYSSLLQREVGGVLLFHLDMRKPWPRVGEQCAQGHITIRWHGKGSSTLPHDVTCVLIFVFLPRTSPWTHGKSRKAVARSCGPGGSGGQKGEVVNRKWLVIGDKISSVRWIRCEDRRYNVLTTVFNTVLCNWNFLRE